MKIKVYVASMFIYIIVYLKYLINKHDAWRF